jgi:lipoprotein-anchoring transpeptidase ErfK/SrfK
VCRIIGQRRNLRRAEHTGAEMICRVRLVDGPAAFLLAIYRRGFDCVDRVAGVRCLLVRGWGMMGQRAACAIGPERRDRAALIALGIALGALFAPAAALAQDNRFPFFSGPIEPAAPAARQAKRQKPAEPGKRKKTRAAEPKALPKPPAGPLQIVISVARQRLTLYANGQPFAHSPVSTGTASHPTPMGIFSIIQKNLHHRSNIYSNAPMPFMQRLTWSGVALHQGVLPGYPASHGCIRLPQEFAQRLWGFTRLGVRVIIARDEIMPAEFHHPGLFAMKRRLEIPVAEEAASEPRARIRLATTAAALDPPAPLETSNDAETEGRRVTGDILQATGTAAPGPDRSEPFDGKPRTLAKLHVMTFDKDTPLRPGPVSVFISRKEGRLYVRKQFAPIFSAPVAIDRPDIPLGTHTFMALEAKDRGPALRWTVVSLPDSAARPVEKKVELRGSIAPRSARAERERAAPESIHLPSAAEALDRITIPRDAVNRISELMSPGASLTISDQGLGPETGLETDFIVVTR